jgi:NCS1 family nucleobase:cation symporter-1
MQSQVQKEVHFGYLPALSKDRQFGVFDFIAIQAGFGIAAWCFLVGGLTGTVVDAKAAVPIILFGNAFPVFLIAPIAILFARYGIDTFIGARSALGYKGSDLFFIIFAVLNLGWITVALFMLGESAIKILALLGASEFWTQRTTGAPFFAITAYLFTFFIAYKGPVAIKWFVRIGVPAIFTILIGLISIVLFREGLQKVFSLKPSEPYETVARSYASALEWNVGLGFSWLPYIGQWSRLAKSEKVAYTGTFLGYGVILNVAGVFGAFTALLVASLDPTDWMIAVGGVSWGVFGLILLILANTTSAVILIYSQAISFKTAFPYQSWRNAVFTTLPAVLLMLSPTFYDGYGSFLALIAFIMAAYGGILVVDFFILKKQVIKLNDLYDRDGVYKYWKGFNPSALITLAVAALFYFWNYNPLTDRAGGLFEYISAGIPTYFLAAILHYILSKYVFTDWQKQLSYDIELEEPSSV